jgi:hypothetical protein
MFQLILVLVLISGVFLVLGFLVFRKVRPAADLSEKSTKRVTETRD